MRHIMLLIFLTVSEPAEADVANHFVRAREIVAWIHSSVEYVATPDVIKSPAETLRTGGDCADMSALMLALLEAEEIHAELLLLDLVNYSAHHAVVQLFGRIYDPTTGLEYRGEFPREYVVGGAVSYANLLTDWDQ